MKTAFFNQADAVGNRGNIDRVFSGRKKRIAEISDLYPVVITPENFDAEVKNLRDLEVIFSTWSMMTLTPQQLDLLPNLKAVLYAAGSVRYFGRPLLERGIRVSCAVAANAIPVAEFALAQVLLAGAGYFRNSRECVDAHSTHGANNYRGCGNYDNRVAVLGNGSISTRLQEFLSHHRLDVVVVPSRASNRTVSLEEAFSTAFAVVNLFPDRDDNIGMLDGGLFSRMADGAVFINVGRGRQVNEVELIEVMKKRPDLTALLDVQWPEPPADGSELYTLPNIRLSGHIAGSKGSEVLRMADYMIEELQRLQEDRELKYAVDMQTLDSMA